MNVTPNERAPLYGAWLEPPDAGETVLLYFHGGGFVFGSLRTHGRRIGALARSARARTLAGDSAGGTLVLNTLVALREAGVAMPAAAVAISPWVDLGFPGASFDDDAPYDFIGKEHCLLAARHSLAGKDAASSDVSPLFARLTDLPPLLVHAGSLETLVDRIRELVARTRRGRRRDLFRAPKER